MTRRRIGFWYRLAALLLRRPLLRPTKRDWSGTEHLPRQGGCVAVTNHVSHFDPLAFAHFLYDNGRLPRFLGKEAIFRVPVVGTILRGAGQIPVYRESADATKAYAAAVDAVRRGECVVIYPEATITRDPGLWPMTGKTGAARVALVTGAPVIPVAQWGPQDVLAPVRQAVRLLPAQDDAPARGTTGRPLGVRGPPDGRRDPRLVTEKIMTAITVLLEEIRGESAPAVRFDPRAEGLAGDRSTRTPDQTPGRRSA